jgi:hypothetical protein
MNGNNGKQLTHSKAIVTQWMGIMESSSLILKLLWHNTTWAMWKLLDVVQGPISIGGHSFEYIHYRTTRDRPEFFVQDISQQWQLMTFTPQFHQLCMPIWKSVRDSFWQNLMNFTLETVPRLPNHLSTSMINSALRYKSTQGKSSNPNIQ